MLLFLGALAAAGAGELPFQLDLVDEDGNVSEFEAIGYAIAAGVVFISFLFGGWVAGRMARYDGALNGVAVALWFLIVVVLFTAAGVYFGDQYNVLNFIDLPNWMTQVDMEGRTTTGIVAAIVGVVLVFLGAALGGMMGQRYHERVDAAVVSDDRTAVVS